MGDKFTQKGIKAEGMAGPHCTEVRGGVQASETEQLAYVLEDF